MNISLPSHGYRSRRGTGGARRRHERGLRPTLLALEDRTLLSSVPAIAGVDKAHLHALTVLKAAPQASKPTGFLKSAEALNSTTIRVHFKSPMSRSMAPKLRYEVPGLQVTGIQMSRDGRTALLTTTPQDGTAYTVRVSQVQGSGGKAHVMKQATAPFSGRLATRVLDVKPASDTSLLVTYSQPMGPQAALLSSYAVTAEGAQPVQVTGARFTDSTNTVVEVQTTPQSYGTYSLSANNVTDTAGQQVYFDGRHFTGNPRGAVLSVAATSYTRVVVAFNEPMADNALAPQHYSLKDILGRSLLVTDAEFDGPLTMVVVLTTAPQANVPYQLTVSNVTDLMGDDLTINTGSFKGIAAPALIKAVPTQANRLVLTFTGAVGDSALAPSTYNIEQLDDSGAVVGTLPIRSAGFVGDQRTVVELVTPVQNDAKYRITTTNALTDVAGSPLPSSQKQFQGLGSRPSLVAATSTGPGSMLVTFSKSMSDDALAPSSYAIRSSTGAPLPVLDARFVGNENRVLQLTTGPQASVDYTIVSIAATDLAGISAVVPADSTVNTFAGRGITAEAPSVNGPPRVIGAASLSNTEVIVAFSEPMAANAAKPEHYYIVQENVNPEAGALLVTGAEFYGGDPSVVKLTTLSQNELTYRVTVVSATDLAGNAMSPSVLAGGLRIDPSSSTFPGTAPRAATPESPATLKDSDGDGLPDNAEMRGWLVTVHNIDGTTTTRGVTSDPSVMDTDGDGLNDAQEANLRFDPRRPDSDDDQLGDYAEFNEIYSNGLDQDTDRDTLDDFVEYSFFKTSPDLADSDGDQISDSDEILANRNPRVADLPRPEIEVGEIKLELNVHFTETNAKESRDLDTKDVKATLTQSESRSLSRQSTVNLEAKLHAEIEAGFGDGSAGGGSFFKSGIGTESTAGYTFQQTEESSSEMQNSYENSFTTEKEVTSGFTSERHVEGAVMKATVSLRNVSTLAYRIKNLQVTAFIQDPADRSRLTPVATLLPDAEPAEGYTLGPLVTNRGPLIFSNTTIVPTLVESLMSNSSGLVFRISNYDIINEDGRNFAFVSQDVTDRTTQVVIDFGGARTLRAKVSGESIDENLPGDETEIHRVAVASGRAIDDTDGDGTINAAPGVRFVDADFSNASGSTFAYEDGGEATDGTGDETYVGNPQSVILSNNRWRAFAFPSTITEESVLEFDFLGRGGEIQGIGVDDDLVASPDRIFQLGGSQTDYGIQTFHDYSGLSLRHYAIPIGQYAQFLGDNNYLTFVMDNDQGSFSLSEFFNVRLSGDVEGDRRVTFDLAGKQVGIPLFDALNAIGLDHYEARLDPQTGQYHEYRPGGSTPVDLTEDQMLNSYSTFVEKILSARPTSTNLASDRVFFSTDPGFVTATRVHVSASGNSLHADRVYFIRNLGGGAYSFYKSADEARAGGETGRINLIGEITADVFSSREKIYRIRGIANDSIIQKYWEILTPAGIDQVSSLGDLSLKANAPVSLNFVQDLDKDGLPADVEYLLRTSDSPEPVSATDSTPRGRDTDGDGLDDRFEALIGWTVSTPLRTYTVYSSPNRADSNFDTPKPGVDSDDDNVEDRLEFDGSDGNVAPAGWNDKNGNGLRDRFEVFQGGPIEGAVPNLTSVDTDLIRFDQGSQTGYEIFPSLVTKVRVSADGGGVLAGKDYFLRKFTPFGEAFYAFFPSEKDATDNTNRVDLTSNITAVVGVLGKDLVLDPIRRDTDNDGINDATELVGFQITRIETGLKQLVAHTDPLTPFTDSDTFTDGFEKFVGLDPTDGRDTDEDGDGLPDIVETSGWAVGKLELLAEIQSFAIVYNVFENNVFNDVRFTLQYGSGPSNAGNTTPALSAVYSTRADVADALNSLPAIRALGGKILVELEKGIDPFVLRAIYTITFGGGMLGVNQPPLIASVIGIARSLVSEVQDGGKDPNSYVLEGVSTVPYQQGPLSTRTSTSRTDSVDSDGDGLTDYEEFFLRTDAASTDTDGDGIDDRTESLGYALGHKVGTLDIGIIRTDPLDADTDNDLRSDGDEAELADNELKQWVVRATGTVKSGEAGSSTAYRVYSNPILADGDLDGLVDGEEFVAGTDPGNANTDGDKRDDGVEVRGGLNPLIQDYRATVVAQYVDIQGHGGDDGNFDIQIAVRLPDDTGVAGLSSRTTKVLDLKNAPLAQNGTDNNRDDRYYFARDFPTQIDNASQRSLTFSLTANQKFMIEGFVTEYDGSKTEPTGKYVQFSLGGFDGIRPTTVEPSGSELAPPPDKRKDTVVPLFTREGSDPAKPVQYLYFWFNQDNDPSLRVGNPDGLVRGIVAVYFIIE